MSFSFATLFKPTLSNTLNIAKILDGKVEKFVEKLASELDLEISTIRNAVASAITIFEDDEQKIKQTELEIKKAKNEKIKAERVEKKRIENQEKEKKKLEREQLKADRDEKKLIENQEKEKKKQETEIKKQEKKQLDQATKAKCVHIGKKDKQCLSNATRGDYCSRHAKNKIKYENENENDDIILVD